MTKNRPHTKNKLAAANDDKNALKRTNPVDPRLLSLVRLLAQGAARDVIRNSSDNRRNSFKSMPASTANDNIRQKGKPDNTKLKS